MAKKWIQAAIKKPGVFKAKAKAMGVSTMTLARRWAGKAGVWGKRARLATTLMGMRKRGGRKARVVRAARRRR